MAVTLRQRFKFKAKGNLQSPALDELVRSTCDKVTAIPMIKKDESEVTSQCLPATNKNPKRLLASHVPKA
jgi:hypothetical protein